MTAPLVTASEVRHDLMARREIALIDVRSEAVYATGHPLFAAQMPLDRLKVESVRRIPRRSTKVVVYDNGEGIVASAADALRKLGYSNVHELGGNLAGWRDAGYELFEDINSYSKAFGELVEHRCHTPSLTAADVKTMIDRRENMIVLDARRFDEYQVMSIPTAVSVPGAELVLRARALAPDPSTRIVVNCAGRTRSLIGAQSLINAGVPNRVDALRNGTIGWTLAGLELDHGSSLCFSDVSSEQLSDARNGARETSYRSGVRRIDAGALAEMARETDRTLYRLDVRTPQEYCSGHIAGFRSAPGGQLVQETDIFLPVRGARVVLADNLGPRADMTASWLAQMAWEVYVLDGGFDQTLEIGNGDGIPSRSAEGKYKRPYEGTDNSARAMEAYLEWEFGLVEQLARDGSHGFFVTR
jgi:rhodanese-related sulfurtransferase